MTLFVAALLGVIQGIFMFLPVSSTAHLVLAQHWLIRHDHPLPPPDSPEMILFDLVVHVGTLVSIVVVFWSSLKVFCVRCVQQSFAWAKKGGRENSILYPRLFLLGMFSVLCTGVLGLSFKAAFEHIFATPYMVGVTLILTGALLWWTDRLKPRRRGLKKINAGVAGVIGLAQGMALMPGLSRSAMTIVFALFTGLKRRWAAEYSFFLAIPTICAATLLQGVEVFRLGGLGEVSPAALIMGFVVAALVGIVSLKLVVYFLYKARLKVFSFYVWLLAAAILSGLLDLSI
ncbi:Bacitracin resistance protein BacA [Desulfonatronospira thiodismutans ASO3-1]|uniref:Undecaprenyl-diphosphatase n=1 Tax=Desulfonatronospira thiodismutans ASO3-1 TaxID=555779 RepID=D6ST68_9BACT|nr:MULTISPECIES: undecaprenyl-diphosphate phosphatase [Desulfonatronospira]EFI33884.1 Bacitracin resistance protein BacA [Desulfonatronospira thiodismutans ASO3-1]RQD78580.1 MAG: undecaprenyl-diphosphate phosphatase [Desulfonatronospira sp. MSAO_Bac3]